MQFVNSFLTHDNLTHPSGNQGTSITLFHMQGGINILVLYIYIYKTYLNEIWLVQKHSFRDHENSKRLIVSCMVLY